MKLPFSKKKKTAESGIQKKIAALKQEIDSEPKNVRLYIRIAETYLAYDMKKEAVEAYITAAEEYKKQRSPQIVIAIYENILSLDPDRTDIYSKLADFHLKLGYTGDGVSVLEKLAKNYIRNNKKYEASQVLKRITDIDPTSTVIKKKVSAFFRDHGLLPEESDIANDDTKTKKTNDPSAMNIVQDKQFFDLEYMLATDSAIDFSGESESDFEYNGEVSHETIFDELRNLLDNAPTQDTPEFHYNLGKAYRKCGEFEEAVEEFLSAIYGHKDKVACYLQLAQCSLAMNRFEAAIGFIREGLRIKNLKKDERSVLMYQLGVIHKAEGNYVQALKVFKKMFEMGYRSKLILKQIQQLKELSAE